MCIHVFGNAMCVYVCLQMCMSVLKCGGGGGSPHPIRTSSSFQPTCALHLRMDADTAFGYTSIASQDSAVGLLIAQGTSPVLRLLILMTFETLQPFIYKDQRLWNNSVQGESLAGYCSEPLSLTPTIHPSSMVLCLGH